MESRPVGLWQFLQEFLGLSPVKKKGFDDWTLDFMNTMLSGSANSWSVKHGAFFHLIFRTGNHKCSHWLQLKTGEQEASSEWRLVLFSLCLSVLATPTFPSSELLESYLSALEAPSDKRRLENCMLVLSPVLKLLQQASRHHSPLPGGCCGDKQMYVAHSIQRDALMKSATSEGLRQNQANWKNSILHHVLPTPPTGLRKTCLWISQRISLLHSAKKVSQIIFNIWHKSLVLWFNTLPDLKAFKWQFVSDSPILWG